MVKCFEIFCHSRVYCVGDVFEIKHDMRVGVVAADF